MGCIRYVHDRIDGIVISYPKLLPNQRRSPRCSCSNHDVRSKRCRDLALSRRLRSYQLTLDKVKKPRLAIVDFPQSAIDNGKHFWLRNVGIPGGYHSQKITHIALVLVVRPIRRRQHLLRNYDRTLWNNRHSALSDNKGESASALPCLQPRRLPAEHQRGEVDTAQIGRSGNFRECSAATGRVHHL